MACNARHDATCRGLGLREPAPLAAPWPVAPSARFFSQRDHLATIAEDPRIRIKTGWTRFGERVGFFGRVKDAEPVVEADDLSARMQKLEARLSKFKCFSGGVRDTPGLSSMAADSAKAANAPKTGKGRSPKSRMFLRIRAERRPWTCPITST